MTHLTWKMPLSPVLLAAAFAAQAEGSARLEFFVSPSGNDTHPGTRAKPFATVERARAAVRTARSGSAATTPATVHLRGGTYCLRETFTLGSDDSNTTYAAYRKEAARLTGGRPITNFTA